MNQTKQSLKPFFIIWGGQALSLLGSAIVQFALIWWLTKETGSATVLATASLVGFLPPVLLGPFVGVLIDRWNRRWTMALSDTVVALATVVLAVLFWTGTIQIWHIYVLLFVRSLGGSFHGPALQASTTLMVPKEHLTRIQGMNQMLEGGLAIVGAPLGALFLEILPMQGVLAIDVFTFLFAVTPLLFIFIPQPIKEKAAELEKGWASYWRDLRLGLHYVWSWKGIMIMMVQAMLINLLLGPSTALLPLLVTDHFGGDALQLGFLQSGFGVGVVSGGILLGIWGGFRKRVYTVLIGLIGLGASFLLIGLTPAVMFWLAVVGAFLAGGTVSLVNGPARAIFQAAVAPEMQGRVFALLRSLGSAITPLGLMLAGPGADLFGVRAWFWVAGIMTAVVGVAGFFMPALLRVEEGRATAEAAPLETPVETAVSN